MITKILMGVSVGALAGAMLGYFRRCSSGACPLTSNPYRGAIWGGVMGLLITFASCSPPRETVSPVDGKTAEPTAARPAETGKQSETSQDADKAVSQAKAVLHARSESDFKNMVLSAKGTCLVDFYAAWCPPCHTLAPIISALAEKYAGKATVCKIDVDEVPPVAEQYLIRAMPTVLFIKDGKEVDRYVGLRQENEYAARLDELLSTNGDAK